MNKIVTITLSEVQSIPLICPVCSLLMRSRDDELAYLSLKCCDSCASFFAKPKRSLWNSGWRPSKEEIDIMKKQLNPISVLLNVDDI